MLLKSRGQTAKATEQAGRAEIPFQREREDSKRKWRGPVLRSRADSTACHHHTAEHQCTSPWVSLPVRRMFGGGASLLGSHGHWHHMLHGSQQAWEVGLGRWSEKPRCDELWQWISSFPGLSYPCPCGTVGRHWAKIMATAPAFPIGTEPTNMPLHMDPILWQVGSIQACPAIRHSEVSFGVLCSLPGQQHN